MSAETVVRGDYIQGAFSLPRDPNGQVFSSNPGDLDAKKLSFPFSFEHVQDAVASSRRSFQSWRRRSSSERKSALVKYRKTLELRKEELARAASWEIGKPLWDSKLEVAETLTWIDTLIRSSEEQVKEHAIEGAQGHVRYFPRGVFVVVVPPSQMLLTAHKFFIPALVLGNTVVFKSPIETPLTAQILAEAFHDSGLPPGCWNLLHGDFEIARRLVAHSDVDGILYAGLSETVYKIQKHLASDYWKMTVLDLDGKNGMVVWNDCDYKKALHEALFSAFVTTGQRQTSAHRILVHHDIFDKFMTDFHALAKKVKVGYGLSEGSDTPFIGPMLSEEALEHYLRAQGIAVREGAEEIMRGKSLERNKKGYYVSPSIHWVKTPDPKSVYQKTEIFGPNAALYSVRDLEEASEILNQTPFGLVGSVYTNARENFLRLVDDVRMGTMHWNRPTTDNHPGLPWGGLKRSGNARSMGAFAPFQCTHPIASLEEASPKPMELPASMPTL